MGSLSAGVAEANHRPPRAPSARTPTAARLCELSGWGVGAGRLRAFGVGLGTRPTTGRVEPPRYLVVLVFGGCTRHEPPELHRRSSSYVNSVIVQCEPCPPETSVC